MTMVKAGELEILEIVVREGLTLVTFWSYIVIHSRSHGVWELVVKVEWR